MEPAILTSTNRLYRHYIRRVQQILFRFNDIRELIRHEGSKGTRVEGGTFYEMLLAKGIIPDTNLLEYYNP